MDDDDDGWWYNRIQWAINSVWSLFHSSAEYHKSNVQIILSTDQKQRIGFTNIKYIVHNNEQ